MKTNKKVVKVVKPTYKALVEANAKLVKEVNYLKDKNTSNINSIESKLIELGIVFSLVITG